MKDRHLRAMVDALRLGVTRLESLELDVDETGGITSEFAADEIAPAVLACASMRQLVLPDNCKEVQQNVNNLLAARAANGALFVVHPPVAPGP